MDTNMKEMPAMRMIVWLPLAVLSLAISTTISFNARSFGGFLTGSILIAAVILVASALSIRFLRDPKMKRRDKAIFCAALVFGAFVLIAMIHTVSIKQFGCLMIIQPAYFRTNILTGSCDFGGSAGCIDPGPWYYRRGCDISEEERFEVFRSSRYYAESVRECLRLCLRGDPFFYCGNRVSHIAREVSCDQLITCEAISCDGSDPLDALR